jgi:hypothetical protein
MRRQPMWWLALLLLVGALRPAGAQEPAMTPDAFARMLEQLSGQIASGEPGGVPQVRIPAVWAVEADGQRYEMPAGWIDREMRSARQNPASWPARRSVLLARLGALRLEAQALAERAGAGPLPAGDARAALTDVLARAEYKQIAQASAVARLRERVLAWMMRLWQRLGGGPLGQRGTAVALAWILTILAIMALATMLARMLMRPDRTGFPLRPGGPDGRGKPARAWARDALGAADAREAIRCAYRAVVSGLEEEGAWRRDDTRTPREYGRLLPASHRRRTLFTDVARRFEEIWFGARAATDDDRAAVLARLKELGCLPAE